MENEERNLEAGGYKLHIRFRYSIQDGTSGGNDT